MYCGSCGTEIARGTLFCSKCGKKIPEGMYCGACGAVVKTNEEFCSICGLKVTNSKKNNGYIEILNYFNNLPVSQKISVGLLLVICVVSIIAKAVTTSDQFRRPETNNLESIATTRTSLPQLIDNSGLSSYSSPGKLYWESQADYYQQKANQLRRESQEKYRDSKASSYGPFLRK